ncbi:MAG: dihydroorotate dehydrogenase-like protein [Holophagaceae bacterium]|nr:dihydroorotate dehydrogenase-like protein [Holophagaceae bacterium]
MDLSTTYLGLKLPHPLMAGASPLSDEMDSIRRLEDAGTAAIVLRSLFEEQITREQEGTIHHMDMHSGANAEALSYFPRPDDFRLGPEAYLDHLWKVKQLVNVPVIASLNGITPSGWLDYAKQIEAAGADALELNIYYLATEPQEDGGAVELRTVQALQAVKKAINIPVAVKLSPFFSSMVNFAVELDRAGADGLVLFNRFLQPDLDIENLEVVPKLVYSTSAELLLRVRWLALIHGHVRADLAVSGGVHTAHDALKAVMAGASAVQMVSALMQRGPEHLTQVRDGMTAWLERHEYESLGQALGSLSHARTPNPQALARANYMRILQGWMETSPMNGQAN